jgi:hypothetical protein
MKVCIELLKNAIVQVNAMINSVICGNNIIVFALLHCSILFTNLKLCKVMHG